MSLKAIIEGFMVELDEKVKAQEYTISAARRTIILSKQAVMAIHREEIDYAKEKLIEAKKTLNQAEIVSSSQDLVLNVLNVAKQEYAEAEVLLSIIETGRFPDPHQLGIPTISYVLGLADSIGEFRRRALASLRKRDLNGAESCLQIMNEIYSELLALESAYRLAPDLRHKCDVAGRLIEISLGDITTEVSRTSLEKSIRELEKQIKQNT